MTLAAALRRNHLVHSTLVTINACDYRVILILYWQALQQKMCNVGSTTFFIILLGFMERLTTSLFEQAKGDKSICKKIEVRASGH